MLEPRPVQLLPQKHARHGDFFSPALRNLASDFQKQKQACVLQLGADDSLPALFDDKIILTEQNSQNIIAETCDTKDESIVHNEVVPNGNMAKLPSYSLISQWSAHLLEKMNQQLDMDAGVLYADILDMSL